MSISPMLKKCKFSQKLDLFIVGSSTFLQVIYESFTLNNVGQVAQVARRLATG